MRKNIKIRTRGNKNYFFSSSDTVSSCFPVQLTTATSEKIMNWIRENNVEFCHLSSCFGPCSLNAADLYHLTAGARRGSNAINNNLFMLSVRISSYGCTQKVWRARKIRKSCARR